MAGSNKKTKKTSEGATAEPQVAERMMELFHGSETVSGTHGAPDKDPDGLKWNIKRTAQSLRVPVTVELWRRHLAGERPLGVVPIREDNSCSWGSIDFDVYDVDLLDVIAELEKTKFPLVPCVSKSGGLHLFLFLEKPESAADVIVVLKDAAAALGMADCEIFPKQKVILAERNDVGNWMVMPYFGGTFDGKLRYQHGLKKSGAEMTVSEFLSFAVSKKTTITEFAALLQARKAPSSARPGAPAKKSRRGDKRSPCDFTDGPPCLQHITAEGPQKDGRKRTLFMMGIYFKKADESGWKERLDHANRAFSPPLAASEVTGVINSLEKKDYEYTCKEEPMASHCNSSLCRLRKLGVGGSNLYPEITDLSKLDTDPPIWFATVEGERIELTSDELLQYPKFLKACMNRVNKVFSMLRQDQWNERLNEVMQNVEILPVPHEVGLGGRFVELLSEYLNNTARGDELKDVADGRPWEDVENGVHWLKLTQFETFLVREGFKNYSRGQIAQRFREMGGRAKFFNLTTKGKGGFNAWAVPSDKLQVFETVDPGPVPNAEQV